MLSNLIVSFTDIEKYYLLKGEDLILFIENAKRKSIPLFYFKTHALEITRTLFPPLDYLTVLEKIVEF